MSTVRERDILNDVARVLRQAGEAIDLLRTEGSNNDVRIIAICLDDSAKYYTLAQNLAEARYSQIAANGIRETRK